MTTNHTIKIQDLRPIGSKTTRVCIKCHCSGKNLNKYRSCEKYKKYLDDMKKEQEAFMNRVR
jgi:hypothetical protein